MVDALESEYRRKHDCQNDHQQQWIEHRPEKTNDRSLVADRKVPTNKVEQKMGVRDKLADLTDRAELRIGGVDENRGFGG